jgi:hypothetical protein
VLPRWPTDSPACHGKEGQLRYVVRWCSESGFHATVEPRRSRRCLADDEEAVL